MTITETMVKKWMSTDSLLTLYFVGDHRLIEELRGKVADYNDDFIIIKDQENHQHFITWEAIVDVDE